VLRTQVGPLSFDSPVCLGAGFDKNARAVDVLSTLGFGAIEVGAVSLQPCPGNAGCRAIRLVDERSVATRYGVPNEGATVVRPRLAARAGRVPIGVNIIWNSGSRPESAIEEVVADMAATVAAFEGVASYMTLNFACPNIRGESHFNDLANVRLLFDAVHASRPAIPVFLKFRHRPDPVWIEGLVTLSKRYPWVQGFIPIAHVMREMGVTAADGVTMLRGSISGEAIREESLEIVRRWAPFIDQRRHVLVATGGISSARHVFDAMAAGAGFVQIVAALVYEGPGVARQINDDLARLLQTAGYSSTADLVGRAAPAAESLAVA
jgi:dihydroorotate dehydrogenase (fumarate)/dihydroorotate dehydrogenase